MNSGEKMLLSDAIETAILSEKKVIRQRKLIICLSAACTWLAIRLMIR